MKRTLTWTLVLALLLTLCACTAPAVRPEPSPAPSPEPAANAVAEPALCMTLEKQRLYAQPISGAAPTLLLDRSAVSYARRGDELVASFEDGAVRKIDLRTGEERTVLTELFAPTALLCADSGLVYQHMTLEQQTLYYYNESAGHTITIAEDSYNSAFVSGDTLYYITYDSENGYQAYLASLDLSQQQENWRIEVSEPPTLFACGESIFVEMLSWEEPMELPPDGLASARARLYTLDAADGTLTELDMPYDPYRYSLCAVLENGYLIEDRDWQEAGFYFAAKDGTQAKLAMSCESPCYCSILDREDNTLLLRSSESRETEVFGESGFYSVDRTYLFDAATQQLTEVTALGENQRLFASGDFPQMDSSTARKPFTQRVYSLFCLESGAGGKAPVTNKTHGAWTAIADRRSDIAMLTAPTEEEQAYLSQQGVEVEMKLCGAEGLVFVTNRACGVSDLTIEQIRAIYRGEITNWKELGGVDHAISPLYRNDQSGSQRNFEKLIWAGEETPDFIALGFRWFDEMATIVNECLYDPYCLGYSAMTYVHDVFSEPELQVMRIGGFEASAENLKSGDYVLGIPEYAVIRADEEADSPTRRLYDWFGSPTCDDLLYTCGMVALH